MPHYLINIILVSQFGFDHLAVQASNVGDGLVLRADSLAGAGVDAVTLLQ